MYGWVEPLKPFLESFNQLVHVTKNPHFSNLTNEEKSIICHPYLKSFLNFFPLSPTSKKYTNSKKSQRNPAKNPDFCLPL